MIRINLLPHREEKRKRRQQQFQILAGISAVVANPFANMALSSKIKPRQLTIDAPSLMVACGLAMRRFDPS